MKNIAYIVGLNSVLIFLIIHQTSAQSIDRFTSYENSAYGIKLLYPSSWKKIVLHPLSYENPTTSFLVNFSSPKNFISSGNSSAKVVIHIENVSSHGLELDEYNYLETRHIEETSPSFSLIGANTTILVGKPAYQVQYTETLPQGIFETYQIWTIENGKVYTISYAATGQEFPSHISTVQKMINSFGIVK
jgi:hypothetical protein